MSESMKTKVEMRRRLTGRRVVWMPLIGLTMLTGVLAGCGSESVTGYCAKVAASADAAAGLNTVLSDPGQATAAAVSGLAARAESAESAALDAAPAGLSGDTSTIREAREHMAAALARSGYRADAASSPMTAGEARRFELSQARLQRYDELVCGAGAVVAGVYRPARASTNGTTVTTASAPSGGDSGSADLTLSGDVQGQAHLTKRGAVTCQWDQRQSSGGHSSLSSQLFMNLSVGGRYATLGMTLGGHVTPGVRHLANDDLGYLEAPDGENYAVPTTGDHGASSVTISSDRKTVTVDLHMAKTDSGATTPTLAVAGRVTCLTEPPASGGSGTDTTVDRGAMNLSVDGHRILMPRQGLIQCGPYDPGVRLFHVDLGFTSSQPSDAYLNLSVHVHGLADGTYPLTGTGSGSDTLSFGTGGTSYFGSLTSFGTATFSDNMSRVRINATVTLANGGNASATVTGTLVCGQKYGRPE